MPRTFIDIIYACNLVCSRYVWTNTDVESRRALMTKVSDVPVLSTFEILLLAVLTVVTGQLTQNKNYESWWCRSFQQVSRYKWWFQLFAGSSNLTAFYLNNFCLTTFLEPSGSRWATETLQCLQDSYLARFHAFAI